MIVLAFWITAIVGMFVAGLLSDWHDRRVMSRSLNPWQRQGRVPGEFERGSRDA